MTEATVSNYARLSNGGRVLMSLIGTVNANGAQVFVQNLNGELLTTLKLANPEDAELELAALSEQMDLWEANQNSKRDAAGARKYARG